MDKTNSSTITISQQSLNLIRQIVGAQGWSKNISDIYVGGKLLVEVFPNLDDLSWLSSEEDIVKMSHEERVAYLKKDKEWGEKKMTFIVTDIEIDVIKRAFRYFANTAASAKKLGPSLYFFELIIAFDIKDSEIDSE